MMTDKQFDSYKKLMLMQLQDVIKAQNTNPDWANEKLREIAQNLENELQKP